MGRSAPGGGPGVGATWIRGHGDGRRGGRAAAGGRGGLRVVRRQLLHLAPDRLRPRSAARCSSQDVGQLLVDRDGLPGLAEVAEGLRQQRRASRRPCGSALKQNWSLESARLVSPLAR
ncbi:MAG: hypothetical protein MZV64_14780 [Ignavibacteriales bacterium]|nr:hypothetical protein [Ignavibacteriales bacterium]